MNYSQRWILHDGPFRVKRYVSVHRQTNHVKSPKVILMRENIEFAQFMPPSCTPRRSENGEWYLFISNPDFFIVFVRDWSVFPIFFITCMYNPLQKIGHLWFWYFTSMYLMCYIKVRAWQPINVILIYFWYFNQNFFSTV